MELKTPVPAKATTAKKSKGKSNSSSKAKSSGAITKNKKPLADRHRQKKDEVPPKAGEPTSKTVGETTWHWCIHHMAWNWHPSDQCRLGKEREQEQNKKSYKAAVASTIDPVVKHQQGYIWPIEPST